MLGALKEQPNVPRSSQRLQNATALQKSVSNAPIILAAPIQLPHCAQISLAPHAMKKPIALTFQGTSKEHAFLFSASSATLVLIAIWRLNQFATLGLINAKAVLLTGNVLGFTRPLLRL